MYTRVAVFLFQTKKYDKTITRKCIQISMHYFLREERRGRCTW